MTREQQKKLKELRLAFPKMLREIASQHKIKRKDLTLYAANKDLFYDATIFVSVNDKDECICSIREHVKPLWLDELLWELLDMEENRKQPTSFRAVGAFTVAGVKIYEKSQTLDTWTPEELRNILEEYVAHFSDSISNGTYDQFEKNIEQPYHGEVRMALYYIHEGRYQEALDAVGDRAGAFKNQGIDINDSIRNICNK